VRHISERFNSLLQNRPLLVVAALFVFAIAVMANTRRFLGEETGDRALWDYIAQSILRGAVPYRDVVEIKTPLSPYMSAAAMWLGKLFGMSDLLAVRFLDLLLGGGLAVSTYRVAEVFTRSRLAAFIAYMIPLSLPAYVGYATRGTEPKLQMILFGMISLALVSRDKPFWAGLTSMLSCLSWQPGLLFTGVAVLAFSNYLRTWRDCRALKALAGAILPLAIMVLYFLHAGALGDLWRWTFAYDLTVYAPGEYKSAGAQVRHIVGVIHDSLGALGMVYAFLAVIGFAMLVAKLTRDRRRSGSDSNQSTVTPAEALVIATVVYCIYSRFDFNHAPYLIPLIPLVAVFAGWAITQTLRAGANSLKTGRRGLGQERDPYSIAGAVVVCSLLGLAIAGSRRAPDFKYTLREQYAAVQPLADRLSQGDKFYAQADLTLLVLLNRPSVSKYIRFDRGKDDYVAKDRSGGFADILGDIEASAPKYVQIDRVNESAHKAEFKQWLDEHYTPLPLQTLDDVYIRKEMSLTASK
jgi:hypothetical protein